LRARVSAKDRQDARQGRGRASRRGRPPGAGRIRRLHQGNRGARGISKRRAFAPRVSPQAERVAARLSGAVLSGAEAISATERPVLPAKIALPSSENRKATTKTAG